MWNLVLYDLQGRELRRLPLQGAPITIGRGKDRSLALDSRAVSRHHAQVEARGGSVIVVDEGSANGTLLNGSRVGKPEVLREGDELRIGEFVLRLQRGAEAPPAAPPAAAEAPRILVPEPEPEPAAAAPADSWSSASELLSKQMSSIRSFRSEARSDPAGSLSAFEQDWDKVVASMRELQQQLAGDKRVLLFSISRNSREITAKVADPAAKRGHIYLILSPEHPEGKYREQVAVWLREFGEPDLSYKEPKDAMRYFVQRIASKLA